MRPTPGEHGQDSSEHEPLLNGSVEADHYGYHHHRQQSPSDGELQLRRQTSTIVAVKGAMQKLTGIHTLLVFVPLGLVAGIFKWNAILISSLNFLAIIPLSASISTASGKLETHFGFLVGALINATFGNVVELIVR